MVVTKRTKMSLCQFLGLFNYDVILVLLEKHGISCDGFTQIEIADTLSTADQGAFGSVLDECVRTNGDLRSQVSPKYRFDERWGDLKKCLLLDGYKIEGCRLNRIEPFIEAYEPLEDDLTKELTKGNLSAGESIVSHFKRSAGSFIKANPDYNGCLSHARIALETLVREIAAMRGYELKNEKTAWGVSLSYLKQDGFFSSKEESSIASVYTFISDGSHVPIGFTEEEFTRFGRNLVTSICYFIIKKFNGNQ